MIKMKAKTLFFKILRDNDAKSLSEFSVQHKSRKSEFRFDDLVKTLTYEELITAWDLLFQMVQIAAPLLLEVDLATTETPGKQITLRIAVEVLNASLAIGNLTAKHNETVPVGLLQMMVFLRGIFLRFPSNNESIKNVICQLCEVLWLKNAYAKEELIENCVIYLLDRTLQVKGTKTDVKRVWAMKDALETLFTSNDVEIDENELLAKLKRCVASPLYLSTPEGTKFIEFLLSFDISRLQLFHDAIKLRLPHVKPELGEQYGTIYYNIWMNAVKEEQKDLKEKLEVCCIQDIMYHAVNLQRRRVKSLVPVLKKFMSAFHKKKKEIVVLRMLRDLYEPILWRALRSSDGNVRANAAEIFFDVFPLEDPDFNIADTETELHRQMLVIKDLLTDEYPLVRSLSVVGACLVMSCHWELFSVEIIKTIMKIIVEDLANDSTSSDVRCSVAKGISTLLTGNQLAVPVIKAYLPRLSGLFHDVSEVVRIAFCQLLLSVKKIRFIKYWDIVPVDHLLARLEEDKPTVAKCIVQLIYNSYLPERKPQGFWLSRIIELIKTERKASQVFFQHLPDFVKLETLVNFMCLICRTLSVYIQSKDKKQPKKPKGAGNKENRGVSKKASNAKDEGINTFDNPYVVGGLLDGITIMWLSMQNDLRKPDNKKIFKELIARFRKYLPPLLTYFKDSKVSSTVLHLCGLIPPSFIPELPDICMAKLKKVDDDDRFEDYAVLVMCLCNQGRTKDILTLIKNSMVYGLSQTESEPAAKKRKSSISKSVELSPYLGSKFLEAVLVQNLCRQNVLKNDSDDLKEITDLMGRIQDAIRERKKTLDDEKEKMFLFKSFSSITQIYVLLQGEKTLEDDMFFRKAMTWVANTFFNNKSSAKNTPSRKSGRRSVVDTLQDGTITWKELGQLISRDLLDISADVIVMSIAKDHVSEYADFAKTAVNSAYGPFLLIPYLHVILFISRQYKVSFYDQDLLRNYMNIVQGSLLFTVQLLENQDFFVKVPEADKSEIKAKLRDIMTQHLRLKSIELQEVKALVKRIFESICLVMEPTMESALSDSDLEINLSQHCSVLLSLVTGNDKLLKLFIEGILEWSNEKDRELDDALAGLVVITQAVKESKGFHERFKEEMSHIRKFIESKFLSLDVETADKQEKCILAHAKRLMDYLTSPTAT